MKRYTEQSESKQPSPLQRRTHGSHSVTMTHPNVQRRPAGIVAILDPWPTARPERNSLTLFLRRFPDFAGTVGGPLPVAKCYSWRPFALPPFVVRTPLSLSLLAPFLVGAAVAEAAAAATAAAGAFRFW